MNPRSRLPRASRGQLRYLPQGAAALVGVVLLGGCATSGDFGRERPGVFGHDVHAKVGHDATAAINLPPSEFPLTDDERQLRAYAYALVAPANDRDRWDGILKVHWEGLWKEAGLGRQKPQGPALFDRTAYWRKLNDTARRSEVSGYARIATDARNDVIQLEPFFAVAARVADTDRKRARILAHMSRLPLDERDNALNRNNENAAIATWVCRSLRQRASSYSYAVERMVIMMPSPSAIEAERSITLLRTRINPYCPTGVAIVARGGAVAKD